MDTTSANNIVASAAFFSPLALNPTQVRNNTNHTSVNLFGAGAGAGAGSYLYSTPRSSDGDDSSSDSKVSKLSRKRKFSSDDTDSETNSEGSSRKKSNFEDELDNEYEVEVAAGALSEIAVQSDAAEILAGMASSLSSSSSASNEVAVDEGMQRVLDMLLEPETGSDEVAETSADEESSEDFASPNSVGWNMPPMPELDIGALDFGDEDDHGANAMDADIAGLSGDAFFDEGLSN